MFGGRRQHVLPRLQRRRSAARSPATSLSAACLDTFYSFVVTHAAFELTAIVLSGAAGLRLGHALLAPGRRPGCRAGRRRARDIAADHLWRRRHAAHRGGHRGVLVVGALDAAGREVFGRRGLLARGALLYLTLQGRRAD